MTCRAGTSVAEAVHGTLHLPIPRNSSGAPHNRPCSPSAVPSWMTARRPVRHSCAAQSATMELFVCGTGIPKRTMWTTTLPGAACATWSVSHTGGTRSAHRHDLDDLEVPSSPPGAPMESPRRAANCSSLLNSEQLPELHPLRAQSAAWYDETMSTRAHSSSTRVRTAPIPTRCCTTSKRTMCHTSRSTWRSTRSSSKWLSGSPAATG